MILFQHQLNIRIMSELTSIIKNIKLIISDVDGVITDGAIYLASNGEEFKQFTVEDGAGVAFSKLAGIPVAFISGRFSLATTYRMQEMNIEHCFQGSLNKIKPYEKLKYIYNVSDDEVAFIGDGMIDVPVMEVVGLPVAVENAHPYVKSIAKYTTIKPGGKGALRELVEFILTEKGVYETTLHKMKTKVYGS